ncbi:MAG: methionyl-tRNA formyltransferase [Ilumatobacteraceae bacterium]
MRLAFLGTPEMAVPALRALVAAGHEIVLVVTRADRRRGRGSGLTPSPVKAAALELGLPVTHEIDDLLAIGADRRPELGVVVAYGRIIKPHVLDALPMINVHFSLLPRWRGAAPVERALLAGDVETGVCIMAVEEGLDTGPVFARQAVPIAATTTADELRGVLVEVGTALLVDVLSRPLPEPVVQSGQPTYAEKIAPGELELDWHRSAVELDRWIRVGGAWTTFRDKRLKVHAGTPTTEPGRPGFLAADGATVGTGDGSLRLGVVQPEGKAAMSWADFANGAHPTPGERFGPPPRRAPHTASESPNC